MIWTGMVIAGILNFLSKFLSLNFFDASKMNPVVRKILAYVPSAIFPAIIFPTIFLDNVGTIQIDDNPRILAALIAIIFGIFTRNVIATIFSGLASYWFLIFVV